MIGVIDYGAGNLKSVNNALKYLSLDSIIVNNKNDFDKCSHIILPGVGAFSDAMASLNASGLRGKIEEFVKSGKHILGICLGMQMFFEKSYEDGEYDGLGFMKGDVTRFDIDLKVPHIGWNEAVLTKESSLFDGIEDRNFYFVHSYYVNAEKKDILTRTEYGIEFTSAVEYENIHATQFHPEKSGESGLKLLKNFGGLR